MEPDAKLESDPVEGAPRPGLGVWGAVALALVAVLGLVLGIREISSPDLGFHLATARWILEHGAFPTTEAFTYTVTDHPYVDLQWLFQLGVHALFQVGGPALVTLATILATFAVGALLLVRCRRAVGVVPVGAVALLLFFCLGNHWEPRPHLLSWLWGSLVLLVLEEHGRGSRRWLWALPVLMVLWVNSHSLFVLGLVMIGAHAAGEWIQTRRFDRRLVTWAGVAGLACLLNPYHVRGLLFPFVQLRDIQGASVFKSPVMGISEFMSPFTLDGFVSNGHLALFQPRLFWFLYTALVLVGIAVGWRRLRVGQWILIVGFLYVFWSANKNFGYFVVATLPLAAGGLQLVRRRRAITALGVAAVCFVLVPTVWTGRWYSMQWTPVERGVGFNEAFLPVGAADYLVDHGIEGRLLNTWNDGGYLHWRTGTDVFIYSHGENMGPEHYRRYAEAKLPPAFDALLAEWKPTVAVVPFESQPYWLFHFHQARDWRMAHADERSAVFLHESLHPEVPALDRPRAGEDYLVLEPGEVEPLILRSTQAAGPGTASWWRGRDAWPLREMTRASFFLQTGEVDACIGASLEGLQKATFQVPELLLTLGHALNHRRFYPMADVCYDAFLKADDDDQAAAEIAQARRARR